MKKAIRRQGKPLIGDASRSSRSQTALRALCTGMIGFMTISWVATSVASTRGMTQEETLDRLKSVAASGRDLTTDFGVAQIGIVASRLDALSTDPCIPYSIDMSVTRDRQNTAEWRDLLEPLDSIQTDNVHLAAAGERKGSFCGKSNGATWTQGQIRLESLEGERNPLGFDAVDADLTMGFDTRHSNSFSTGVSIGLNRGETTISSATGNGEDEHDSDGNVSGTAVSVSAYGSYHPTQGTVVQAVAGFGRVDFQDDPSTFATNLPASQRNGYFGFTSAKTRLDLEMDDLTLSPYARGTLQMQHVGADSYEGTESFVIAGQDRTNLVMEAGIRTQGQPVRLAPHLHFLPWLEIGTARSALDLETSRSRGNDLTPVAVDSSTTRSRQITLSLGSKIDFGSAMRVSMDYRTPIRTTDDPISEFRISSSIDF